MKNARRPLLASLLAFLSFVPVGFAGAVGGPKEPLTSARAFARDQFRSITFRAGEDAIVTVDGNGDTDLDLYIYDENGRLVGKDDDGTDFCIVTFNPRWTGPFTVVVRNRGNVYNQYRLRTN